MVSGFFDPKKANVGAASLSAEVTWPAARNFLLKLPSFRAPRTLQPVVVGIGASSVLRRLVGMKGSPWIYIPASCQLTHSSSSLPSPNSPRAKSSLQSIARPGASACIDRRSDLYWPFVALTQRRRSWRRVILIVAPLRPHTNLVTSFRCGGHEAPLVGRASCCPSPYWGLPRHGRVVCEIVWLATPPSA